MILWGSITLTTDDDVTACWPGVLAAWSSCGAATQPLPALYKSSCGAATQPLPALYKSIPTYIQSLVQFMNNIIVGTIREYRKREMHRRTEVKSF